MTHPAIHPYSITSFDDLRPQLPLTKITSCCLFYSGPHCHLSWLCFFTLFLVNLLYSCILEPSSTIFAVACTGNLSVAQVQASRVLFLWVCSQHFVVKFQSWPPYLLPHHSKRQLAWFFAICHARHPVFFISITVKGHSSQDIKDSKERISFTESRTCIRSYTYLAELMQQLNEFR